ncbi:MAG: nucleotidyl transferase AbiEii/AbiGii toxin family protein [Deltaproteobacteria bacterium]|nr:nucleotidyl transferase AbiEii/AbiGii toxin family protein [Deltaproteobacteria bacterium]
MREPVKNMSASVRARLLNMARSSGRDFQELVIRYAVERFLARLVESEHQNRFILKGAMLYIPWNLDDKRTTMDLDLLGFGSPDLENLSRIFRQICEVEIPDDGLVFDKKSVTATPIREASVYEGVRVIVRIAFGTMPIRLQVDVGFGDRIVPDPQLLEFPALLAEHGPVIRSYSPETVIAEKFNAMVLLGIAISRMKDYFDIWMLSRNFTIEGAVLREAIQQTFTKRQTALPITEPIGLSDEFASNESKRYQWQGFVRRLQKQNSLPDLTEVVAAIRDFLMPILTAIANVVPSPESTWSSAQGWRQKFTQTPDR